MLKTPDEAMQKLWLLLIGDFRNLYGHDLLRRQGEVFLANGVKGLRDCSWPSFSKLPPHLFKVHVQLKNLFKRWRFSDDAYSDSELQDLAKDKFLATQVRCALPLPRTLVTYSVLQRARRIVTRILGEYTIEEHESLCRFGKRACVGHPYAKSYLDTKLRGPITGSPEHIEWFKSALTRDVILRDAIEENNPRYQECSALQFVLVPKSYKALRSMMPNTLLGSYYTMGLGRMIQDRLAAEGLNIRTLQVRHQELARRASKNRRYVTADLSSASDSITLQLLRILLPSKWYRAITHGRARYVTLDGRQVYLSSIVTMGLGQTFPLQTLIFYSLIKAIGELDGNPHMVSVYGDDLIYSRHLHKYVATVFPKLHLVLNMDKTYVDDFFRESCGGDFCRGVAVRPFQPEGGGNGTDRQSLIRFLYKAYNGLRERWEYEEIPETLGYILNTLILLEDVVLQVPPSFPATAGIRVERPQQGLLSPVRYDPRTQRHVFLYYRNVAKDRDVSSCRPYYWEWLRSHSTGDSGERFDQETDLPVLKWIYDHKRTVWCRLTRRNYRRLKPTVSRKGTDRYLVQTGSSSAWV